MRELFRQFSFPGGIPSHVAPETPGSIHEGGELGYALAHAYGAAFDNPDLLVCCVVGDGEAETGPLATSWHSNKFLNPQRDGAVLPILHLNGYKIANPTVLARIPEDELVALMEGYGHRPLLVTGDDPAAGARATSPPRSTRRSTRSRVAKRSRGAAEVADDRPPHAEGLDRPGRGRREAGRGHVALAPGADRRTSATTRRTSRLLEEWMRSYRPEELFDERGRLVPSSRRCRRRGEKRMSANPHANGGVLRDLVLPDFRDYAVEVNDAAPRSSSEATRVLGTFLRDVDRPQPGELPHLRPGRDRVEPARRRLRGDRAAVGGRDPADRRGPRARGPRDGGALRAPLPGLARGLPAHRPARPLQLLRGVHPHHRLDVQPAREVAEGDARHPVAPADRLAQLPALLARLAPGPQRLLAPGSGLHRPRREQEGGDDPRLPAAGREHAPLGRRPLPAHAALRERDRRRQAAGARLPLDGRRDRPLHARARHLGLGLDRRRRASPTSCSAAPATSRRSRRSPPPRSCASGCPT